MKQTKNEKKKTEIVAYVSRIVDSGFAYAVSTDSTSSDSSPSSSDVYFDVAAFKAAGFPYGRLRPEAAAAGARVEALLRTRDEAYARVFCLNPSSNASSSAAASAFAVRSSSAGGEL